MNRLKEIIKELREYCEDNVISPSDDCVLEQATRIYNTEIILNGKSKKQDKPIPATRNQLYALKKMGIEVPKGLSKQEAYVIIKERKERGKNERGKNQDY